jgi:hypothetical protein
MWLADIANDERSTDPTEYSYTRHRQTILRKRNDER